MLNLREILLLTFIAVVPNVFADTGDKSYWNVQTSVYTKHFHPKPEHNNHQDLISVDYNFSSKWFIGGASFRNSFRQHSIYVYTGKRFDLDNTPFFTRISGGFIHGYRGKYKHKIPMNGLGIAPAIIPSAGIQVNRFTTEILLLGFNATMVNVGFQI